MMANVNNSNSKQGKKISIWSNKELLTSFLEVFEGFPCLYDPKNKFYSNKHARADALNKMKAALEPNQVSVDEIKGKINNIRTQISHELKKMKESHSGMDTDEIYEPVWWFDLAKYLLPYIKPRKSMDNLFGNRHVGDTETVSQNTTDVDDSTSEEMCDPITSPLYERASTSHERATTSRERSITPNARSAKRTKTVSTSEDTYLKTVETLQVLNENIMKVTDKKEIKETEFANFIAKELGEINDPEILLDAKHEISNIIYKYKKKWLSHKHTEIISFEIDSDSF